MYTFFIYFTFILFSFGQLARISYFGQQINLYLYEVGIASSLIFLFIRYRFRPLIASFKQWKTLYFFIGFLAVSYISGIGSFSLGENAIGLLYMLRLTSYFMYFIYAAYDLKKEKKHTKAFLFGYLLFVVLTIGISILQYFLYPNLRNLSYLGWDPHFLRLFGVFFDTSVAGAMFGLLFLAILLLKLPFNRRKVIKFIFASVFLIFVLFTYSRGLYFSLGLTLLVYLFSKRKIKEFILLVVLTVVFILILPKPFGEGGRLDRIASIGGRLTDYKTALTLWRHHPIIGYGYNRIRYVKKDSQLIDKSGYDITHSGASFSSSYLIILVTGGVVGLVLFLEVLYRLALLSPFAKYAVIFLAFYSVTDNILLHPFVLFLFLQTIILSTTSLFDRSR